MPEAVHSSVRSGIILFDLTRVVEELIYNSLDAGATKVSVSISVGTCYIKVVDDGTGVTRDGLVLLGERYATSKLHHLTEMDAATGSFGFRGEALGSISDVSLLEIVTKTQGRPNGYRKVMKGCKCLYLGIDDDRQDVGTTVVVRDLFYNQPVRRKYLQSSPKKVLHSVKKCVFRIALVHSNVSFKVVDIESDDELLCTKSSSSPLSLLISGLGIEDSSSLHELNITDGILKLSGYVSGPCNTFSIKAFQYVYINSRFICKGPIHKLLNQLATGFKSFDPWKASSGSQDKKRSRCQGYPTYILNLRCPQSHYDLTFEPSRTAVEFKDWVPILAFLEKAVTRFWSEHIAHGESSMHANKTSGKELLKEHGNVVSAEEDLSEVAKRQCRIQNCLLGCLSSPMELLTEENDHFSCRKENKIPFQKLRNDTSEFEGQLNNIGFVHQIDCSFQSLDDSPSKCISGVHSHTEHLELPDDNFFITKNNFLENKFTVLESSFDHVEDKILGSTWGNESLNVDHDMGNGFSALSCNSYEFRNGVEEASKDFKKPTLQSCSLRRSLLSDWESDKFEFQIDGLRTRQRQIDHNKSFDFFPGTAWQEEASSDWPSPSLVTKPEMCTGLDFMSRDSLKSLSTYRERFAVDNNLPPDSVEQSGKLGSGHLSLNSECCSMVSQSLFQTTPWDVEHFTHENTPQGGLGSDRNVSYEHFIDSESGEWIFSHDIMPSSSSQENCSSSSCINTGLGLKDYTVPSRDIYRLLKENNLDNIFTPRHSDILSIETDWLYSKSCGKDNNNNRTVPSCSIPLSTYIHKDENKKERLRYQNCGQIHASKERSRSHSAPPIYRGKRKFLALNDHWTMESKKVDVIDIHDAPTFPETDELKHPLQSSGACNQYFKPSLLEDPLFYGRSDVKKMLENEPDMDKIQNIDIFRKSQCLHIDDDSYSFEDFTTKEATDLMNSESKWRNNCPKIASGDKSQKFNDQYNVLDISSGILHLAGDSLIPQSITKNCLQDAKVLQQVDKKFIPVVADGTLAIIDQHAADERIRLEELRQKVLSGEVKTITYLDAEQELVLPEIGYQLLHTYAEQIQNWGWICNIHAQNSRSFTKNLDLLHKKPTVITLLAVPCILGVNLSDVDLLEFLQQLADTDGSSTMPPSVLRVLNLKACRGAIMFGDTLLPSECSLIVEELKRTSLCFQCAHGRPTTVPLVNLEALHKQIAKLGSGGGGSIELWHGLRRHELSLERASQRLNSSMG